MCGERTRLKPEEQPNVFGSLPVTKKAPDIDRLADALNAWQSDGAGGPSRLEHWLTIVTERGASDLLLVAGLPPSIRVDGTISSLPEGPLDGPEIEDAVLPVPRGTFTTSC